MNTHRVPDLDYSYGALEPHFDARTMELHHGKHHAAYVARLNAALEKHPHLFDFPVEALLVNLGSLPEDIRADVKNHGGGHANHSLFWKILGADGRGDPIDSLSEALTAKFSSIDEFRKAFEAAAAQRFGSGWAWLSLNAFNDLVVHSTANQDSPLMEGLIPVIGLDVWEHAYYLAYQNRRADYIAAFWNVVNWKEAERNFRTALAARDSAIRGCLDREDLRRVS